MRVYLAGPIEGQTLESANSWRQFASEYLAEFGIEGIDPLRGKDYLNSVVGPEGLYLGTYTEHPLSTSHGITQRDRWDTMRADLVFANFEHSGIYVSIGTVMEIGWANAVGKYILSVIPEGNIHDHGMVQGASSLVLQDFTEALKLIPVILNQEQL